MNYGIRLILEEILNEICTTAAGMIGTEPITLAGQEHPSKYTKQGKRREKKAHLYYKYRKMH